jgi:hypothetical protein
MMRASLLVLVGLSTSLFACGVASDEETDTVDSDVTVTRDKRDLAVAAAKVWSAAEFAKLATKDVARGPEFEGAPLPGSEVVCKFVEPQERGELGGKSPKFNCGPCELTAADIAAGKKPCTVSEVTKVKYSGRGRPLSNADAATRARWAAEDAKVNGEVFAEVAGTRLLWALGFNADGVYPVKVTCYGCPEVNPWDAYSNPGSTSAGGRRGDWRWEYSSVEIKAPGKKMETTPDQGFDFRTDAPRIDPAKGGASRDEVDAWKLMAVLLHNGDNKAANQRLYCAKGKLADDGTCSAPLAMMQDVGVSFGSAGFLGFGYKKADFGAWRGQPVWESLGRCQGHLTSQHFSDPVVSESGRAFASSLLDPGALTDEKLTAIFAVSRIAERGQKIRVNGAERPVTVADWVDAFKAKRAELARACGQ